MPDILQSFDNLFYTQPPEFRRWPNRIRLRGRDWLRKRQVRAGDGPQAKQSGYLTTKKAMRDISYFISKYLYLITYETVLVFFFSLLAAIPRCVWRCSSLGIS